MRIAEIEKEFVDNLRQLDDASSQCDYLMMLGMEFIGDENIRKKQYRIGGCKTAIWINVEEADGIVAFTGDSDSLLVRGVLEILRKMYNNQYLKDVRMHSPVFLVYISDEVIYPEIKQNGILKCYQRLATLSIN